MPFIFRWFDPSAFGGGFNPAGFQETANPRPRRPKKPRRAIGSPFTRTLINLAVTLLTGFVYFYLELPAINLQSSDFYVFVGLLCLVYLLSALVSSGFQMENGGPKEYFRFIKAQCLPVGILFALLLVVALVGTVISMPIFRAGAYRELLQVETGDFAAEIAEISFNEIPTLDRDSADFLGDRQMGTLSDMVSQFEYSNDSTQINYQGRPVRVAPSPTPTSSNGSPTGARACPPM